MEPISAAHRSALASFSSGDDPKLNPDLDAPPSTPPRVHFGDASTHYEIARRSIEQLIVSSSHNLLPDGTDAAADEHSVVTSIQEDDGEGETPRTPSRWIPALRVTRSMPAHGSCNPTAAATTTVEPHRTRRSVHTSSTVVELSALALSPVHLSTLQESAREQLAVWTPTTDAKVSPWSDAKLPPAAELKREKSPANTLVMFANRIAAVRRLSPSLCGQNTRF
uniref:Uncharacterized protein n=1 Tax=Calcidiscus leptoporus TaxID=127549 RepID=A0A7S0IXM7_9EUKA